MRLVCACPDGLHGNKTRTPFRQGFFGALPAHSAQHHPDHEQTIENPAELDCASVQGAALRQSHTIVWAGSGAAFMRSTARLSSRT